MRKLARGTVVLVFLGAIAVLVAIVTRRSSNTAANPLIEAACEGDVDRCERLVRSGTPVDATDRERNTALAWAAFCCKPAVVTRLLDLGADPNHANEVGFTPLIYTTFPLEGHELRGTQAERNQIASLLIRHGADVNHPVGDGRMLGSGETALHFAATRRNPDLVRLLLSAGASRDARSNQGYTALDEAKFPDYAPNDEVIGLLQARSR